MIAEPPPAETLSAVDTAWLHMEDPTNLMMVTGVLVFDAPLDFGKLRETVRTRFLSFSRFTQRVVEPLFSLGRPRWEADERFDLGAHLHRLALPAPGDQKALQELVSDLMSTPLDFGKPLWQFHLVEGVGRGCALVMRLHHSIGDGAALVHVLLSMTDRTSRPAVPPRKAVHGAFRRPKRQSSPTLTGAEELMNLVRKGSESATALEEMVFLSRERASVFKGRLGVAKRAAWSDPIPLDRVKAVGHATGATVNDVLLTALTGALRGYMEKRGEMPDGADLRAIVPVDLRPASEVGMLGNRFGLVFLSLPVSLDDPLERLLELKERMDALKESPQPWVAYAVLGAMGMAPHAVESAAIGLFGSKATAVVTNVRGPKRPIWLAGTKVSSAMFWVPQSGRLGLGVSILSYAGKVRLGVATDAGLVPDPESILSGFQADFDRLARRAMPSIEEAS